jgi:hypothetical protein
MDTTQTLENDAPVSAGLTGNRRLTKSVARAKTHIEKLNKPSTLIELPKEEFSVDPRVQRHLNEPRVVAMAADFRPDSMGLITASLRADGHTYIIDGAHRIAAARRAQYTGLIATRLFNELTLQEEAGMFLSLNNTKQVQAIDKFKVRVTLGERQAVNINQVLKAHGLHVDWSASTVPSAISAIVTLEKIYRGAGVRPDGEYSDLLDKVIATVTDVYSDDASEKGVKYPRPLLEGLGIFHAHFGSRIDRERLKETLGAIAPAQLVARARTRRDATGGTLGENAAELIHIQYNHRRKDKLPEWAKVDPRNNYIPNPEQDPLFVDPAQYVREHNAEQDKMIGQKVGA